MADASGLLLLPWEEPPEPTAPLAPLALGAGLRSASGSRQSTPRGGGALFDFRELELCAADADNARTLGDADAGGSEGAVLHPEGLPCLVVCVDGVPALAAPREGSRRIGTLKEGCPVLVYEVRDNWARHRCAGVGGAFQTAWSSMLDADETCVIRPVSELTDEERWIFGDFAALAPPEAEAPMEEAEGKDFSEVVECSNGDADQVEECDPQQPEDETVQDRPSNSTSQPSGDEPRGSALDFMGLFGPPDAQHCTDVQSHHMQQRTAGADIDRDMLAFADIPPEGLQCVVICRSWVPVRLAPTYWSKMVGGLKSGTHTTVYEVVEKQWARHEFALRDGMEITAWSSVADPQHGKLIRPVAHLSWSELEALEQPSTSHSRKQATATASETGEGLAAAQWPGHGGGPDLLQALGMGLAALGLSVHAGPAAVRALRVASREAGAAVAELLPVVQRWCPVSLYVCGGFDGTQEESGAACRASFSAERLHPLTGEWETLPRMLQRRAGAAAAAVAGHIYVCGGSDGEVELRTAERFDPHGVAWEPIAHMLQRRDCAAAANVSNKLYVCGGSRSSLRGAMIEETAECFTPQAGAWEPAPSMLQKRVGAAAASLQGRLFVCGGMEEGGDLRSAEGLEPASLEPAWEALPPMRQTRYAAAAVSLAGKLYVCGGTVNAVAASSVECFDPITRTWRDLPGMLANRSCTAAAGVAGRLYVLGGKAGRLCLNSTERFDPTTQMWKAMAPMLQSRRSPAAAASGGPLHLRVRPGAADELSEGQLKISAMWEDYNRRSASHLRDNAV